MAQNIRVLCHIVWSDDSYYSKKIGGTRDAKKLDLLYEGKSKENLPDGAGRHRLGRV
ncbi:hypothetical protein GCM10020331_016080 [Ectobacillus funiculus]